MVLGKGIDFNGVCSVLDDASDALLDHTRVVGRFLSAPTYFCAHITSCQAIQPETVLRPQIRDCTPPPQEAGKELCARFWSN